MNNMWWRQLERELRRRGYWGVDVIAEGLCGASTQTELRWLKDPELMRKLRPDAIVMGYVTNDPDVEDAPGHSMVKQRYYSELMELKKTGRAHFLDSTLGKILPRLNSQIQDRLVEKRTRDYITQGYPYDVWELKLLEGPNFSAYKQVILDLGRFTRSLGVPFFVVTLPNSPEPNYFEPRYRPVIPLFKEAGIPFYNLLGDFIEQYRGTLPPLGWGINPGNGHPGTLSTHFYARETVDILAQQYSEVLGPRSSPPPSLSPKINDWMPPDLNLLQTAPGEWTFSYPPEGTQLLYMPIQKDHVLMSFDLPVAIDRIEISGPRVEASALYVRAIDRAKGIESMEFYPLGEKEGTSAAWSLADLPYAQGVTSLAISSRIKPAGAQTKQVEPRAALKLKITFDENSVRP